MISISVNAFYLKLKMLVVPEGPRQSYYTSGLELEVGSEGAWSRW